VTLTCDVHPEFGYFCPAPRVRRELRIALVSILFGMVIGAAFVTVRAGQAVETNGVSNNAHLKSSGPECSEPTACGVVRWLRQHGPRGAVSIDPPI
jgi:hypothetical protein